MQGGVRRGETTPGARLSDPPLCEREAELELISGKLDQLANAGEGGLILIEGPAGIGKTRLLHELHNRAIDRDFRVLAACGSDLERDYGFGLVRQLLGRTLVSLGPQARDSLLSGAAQLAAGVFGLGDDQRLGATASEESMYGLYWLVAGLAQDGPIVLVIDDAHWGDSTSLRFVNYLCRRLEDLPVLVSLAARPAEPGAQSDLIAELADDLYVTPLRPSALGASSTSLLIDARLGRAEPELEQACLHATGGNPLLIEEFLSQVEAGANGSAQSPGLNDRGRIGASIIKRSAKLDRRAPKLVKAVAILGDRAPVGAVAQMTQLDPPVVSELVDGLAAAHILEGGAVISFAHPLLRESVLADIPPTERTTAHGQAAEALRQQGADVEEIASHLLLCPQASSPDAIRDLCAAAAEAEARGAPESAAAYLRRALEGPVPSKERPTLLRRLGNAEVIQFDPSGLVHLDAAAREAEDPAEAIGITRQLVDALSVAGLWGEAVDVLQRALDRFAAWEGPGRYDLEGLRAGVRGYDPCRVEEFDNDFPRLMSIVEGRRDRATSLLRWMLAGVGAVRMLPRRAVLDLTVMEPADATFARGDGGDSSYVMQAALALIGVDALDRCEEVSRALRADAQDRPSLTALMGARGYAALLADRRGDLRIAEADLRSTIDLITATDLNPMMATTTVSLYCIDAITERSGLSDVADLIENLELPPVFAKTVSGGQLLEARGAVRLTRGRRREAIDDLRAAGQVLAPVGAGPRVDRWRSRLAEALHADSRSEALALAREELELARQVDSARSVGIALRTLGELTGGKEGEALLDESLATLQEHPSPLERARTLAALGSLQRRGNRRVEARERLREALDLAHRAGAERLEEKLVEELRIAGGRLRRRHLTGVESLTPAELRVASAAAAGATNREIAQDLFLALRTVESHLTSTYQKLSISSRGELAQALRSSATELPRAQESSPPVRDRY